MVTLFIKQKLHDPLILEGYLCRWLEVRERCKHRQTHVCCLREKKVTVSLQTISYVLSLIHQSTGVFPFVKVNFHIFLSSCFPNPFSVCGLFLFLVKMAA